MHFFKLRITAWVHFVRINLYTNVACALTIHICEFVLSANLKYFFDFEEHGITEGVPDGTTIDTDGNLWVAVFNGSCVLHIDPRTDTLLHKVHIPAKEVQMCLNIYSSDNMTFTTPFAQMRHGKHLHCTIYLFAGETYSTISTKFVE